MDDAPATTADQDAWQEIVRAAREQLRRRVELMPAMTVKEVEEFVDTLRQLLWMEKDAATFDRDIESRLSRSLFQD